jgi:hypothetical protein
MNRQNAPHFRNGVGMWSHLRTLACLLAVSLGTPTIAAEPTLYRGEYSLSFLGLTLARANFDSRIDEQSYAIEGSVASAGLGAIFDDTKGTISAAGKFSGKETRPESFRADYVSGKKASVVDIRFSDGNVTKVTNVPPLKKRGKDWLPLGPDDLLAVADPIAATLVQAKSLAEVCNGTIKMFDSELRADLSLTYVSKGKASVQGYQGDTVTCRMNFKPVSGYRKSKRALDYLKNQSRIMVAFAPLGKTGIYAPIHATVGTQIGTITVTARRFEAVR